MRLSDALTGVTRLGLDTAPIIYFIEAHPRYDSRTTEVFRRISMGTPTGVTTAITLTEVLVQPVLSSDFHLQQEYVDLLLNSANLQVVPIDANVAQSAAHLRAAYGLRTPDALQVAGALYYGCEAFLTNDIRLKRVTDLRILVLDELAL